jgi:hypothetical protein
MAKKINNNVNISVSKYQWRKANVGEISIMAAEDNGIRTK